MLASLDKISLLWNLAAIALTILVIVKTNQLSNIAFKIMFDLSLGGSGLTIFEQTILLVALIFSLLFCGYTAVYTFGVTDFDRYSRVKYKVSCASILATKRILIIIVFVIYCLVFGRSLLCTNL